MIPFFISQLLWRKSPLLTVGYYGLLGVSPVLKKWWLDFQIGTGCSVSVCLWHPGHLHLPAVMYSRVKGSACSWWDPLVVPYGCQHQPALPTTPTSVSRGACHVAICGLCPCFSHYGPQSISRLSPPLCCCNIALSTSIMDPGHGSRSSCHRWANILLVGSRHRLSLDGVSSCDIRVSCFNKPCKLP